MLSIWLDLQLSQDRWSTVWAEPVLAEAFPCATLQRPRVYAQGLENAWRVYATDGREVFAFLPEGHKALRNGRRTPLLRTTTAQVVKDCGMADMEGYIVRGLQARRDS